jgi:hypothetical protein
MISLGLIRSHNNSQELVPDYNHLYSFPEEKKSAATDDAIAAGEVSPAPEVPLDVNISFQELLSHPQGVFMFENFCKKEHNSENLHFWTAVVDYRDRYDEFNVLINEAASQIIDHYIKPEAMESINIPVTMSTKCFNDWKATGATPTLFDKPAEEIHNLMKKDAFRRFVKSELEKKPTSPR